MWNSTTPFTKGVFTGLFPCCKGLRKIPCRKGLRKWIPKRKVVSCKQQMEQYSILRANFPAKFGALDSKGTQRTPTGTCVQPSPRFENTKWPWGLNAGSSQLDAETCGT